MMLIRRKMMSFKIFMHDLTLKEVFKASLNPNSESSMSSNLPDFLRFFYEDNKKRKKINSFSQDPILTSSQRFTQPWCYWCSAWLHADGLDHYALSPSKVRWSMVDNFDPPSRYSVFCRTSNKSRLLSFYIKHAAWLLRCDNRDL